VSTPLDNPPGAAASAPESTAAAPPNPAAAALWKSLLEAGLVHSAEAPPTRLESPWYVRLMLGGAGWLAALFMLGFVAAATTWVMETPAASVVVGVGLMVACWWLHARIRDNDFISQLGLACSFCGQALFLFGLFELLQLQFEDMFPWLLITLMQATLAWVMPSSFHRLISTVGAGGALVVLLFHARLLALAAPLLLALGAWLWLRHWYWPGQVSRCRPIAYGLSIATVGLSYLNMGLQPAWEPGVEVLGQQLVPLWSSEWLVGLVFLGLVWALLRRNGLAPAGGKGLLVLGCSVLLALASIRAPGISMGLSILLLGFANGTRLLVGLGIMALLAYGGFYYYQLDISLMAKSGWLALTGLVLLLARWLLGRFLSSPGGGEAARVTNLQETPHA
jgi:hypothetical protein